MSKSFTPKSIEEISKDQLAGLAACMFSWQCLGAGVVVETYETYPWLIEMAPDIREVKALVEYARYGRTLFEDSTKRESEIRKLAETANHQNKTISPQDILDIIDNDKDRRYWDLYHLFDAKEDLRIDNHIIKGIQILSILDYYDGPLSGALELNGKKYYYMLIEFIKIREGPRGFHRQGIWELTESEWETVNQDHAQNTDETASALGDLHTKLLDRPMIGYFYDHDVEWPEFK